MSRLWFSLFVGSIFTLLLVFSGFSTVFAQDDEIEYCSYTSFPGVGQVCDICELGEAVQLLLYIVLFISVIGAFIYAGYLYLTSAANASAQNKAKEVMTGAVIGLALGLSSYLILQALNPDLLSGSCGLESTGTSSDPGSPGVSSSSPPPDDIQDSICQAAKAYRGTSLASGPGDGRLACAWSINNVISNAGLNKIGDNPLYVPSVKNALSGSRGKRINKSEAVCGDITLVVVGSGGSEAHIGICLNEGCTRAISSSSSNKSFSWESSANFNDYYGAPAEIYRVIN